MCSSDLALLAPVLSGIADYSGSKKKFLQVFCLIGGISSSLLYFFQPLKTSVGIPVQLGITILPLFFASIGYWGSIVYYNAYLPEIADPEHHDRISARGFAMGYFGGALLLILILVLTPRVLSYNAGFILVGIWWIGFAQLTFRRLPNTQRKHKKERHIWKMGFLEFGKVLQDIRKRTALKRYLASYFMFNMAVQTVMIMATAFANKEVHGIKTEDLIISKLIWYRESESTRQLEDIKSVIETQKSFDNKYLFNWVKKLNLEKEWQELQVLLDKHKNS